MNSLDASGSNSNIEAVRDAETTLRLIANLPAPRGLENRVIAGLCSAPPSARILSFTRLPNPADNWLRAAAAAAIAFLIVGGGWEVYSRVQPEGATAIIPQPSHSSGFSNAGAVRVPQTLQAPIVKEPALVQPAPTKHTKAPRKATPKPGAKSHSSNKPATPQDK